MIVQFQMIEEKLIPFILKENIVLLVFVTNYETCTDMDGYYGVKNKEILISVGNGDTVEFYSRYGSIQNHF